MRRRAVAVVSLATWVASAAAVIILLRLASIDPRGDPVAIAVETLRRGALIAAWYVVVIAILGVVARVLSVHAVMAIVDAITVAPLRGVVRGALGLGLAGALTLSTPLLAAAAPDDPPIVTLHRLPPSTTPTWATTTTRSPTAPTWATTTTTSPPDPPPPQVVTVRLPRYRAPSLDAAPTPAGATWQVRPGDCFWTIADAVLTSARGRPAADREIVPYWRQLIEQNRSRLRDPANPDLILPGQVLVLPPA